MKNPDSLFFASFHFLNRNLTRPSVSWTLLVTTVLSSLAIVTFFYLFTLSQASISHVLSNFSDVSNHYIQELHECRNALGENGTVEAPSIQSGD